MENRLVFEELFKKKRHPLVLDGALGSLMQQKEIHVDLNLWSSKISINFPEIVVQVHKEYIKAGCDIITTNTFRTNPNALLRANFKIPEEDFVKNSVDLAIEARGDKEVLIAGSNAPAEDCYQAERTISQQELELNHKTHIDLLLNYGCDFILNETQSHFDEIKIITEHCSKNSIPYIVSLFFNDNLKILSGEDLYEVVDYVLNYNPIAVGFNCVKPSAFAKITIPVKLYEKWGMYLNCGAGSFTDSEISCGISPQEYLQEIKNHLEYKPAFVGSCCGSFPFHTKEIKGFLNAVNRN